jgi:hypothetical protein
MNSYLNHGDPEVLEALRAFGADLASAAVREARDPGVVGERRSRLLDVLGVTGSEEAAIVVRDFVDPERNEPEIHTRACVALAALGDMRGVDLLAHDLELTDHDLRTRALVALQELDTPHAEEAVQAHVNRYLAECGACPDTVEISAPRLEEPDTSLTAFVARHIVRAPHSLTIVVGSGAITIARSRQSDLKRGLEGFDVRFATRRLAPEEQIAMVQKARDEVAADPSVRIVVAGMIPGPKDSLPLPHVLTRADGEPYTAKVLFVDPRECKLVMDWWHYVDERAEVPTDFEVILGISRPDNSAISEEEYAIWQLAPEDRKRDFIRAFLAHL